MAPKRHTLEKIIGYADRQCAYIERLTEEDVRGGIVRGRSSGPSVATSAQSMAAGISAVQSDYRGLSTRATYKKEVTAKSNNEEELSSTCSEISVPATPRRTSAKSYTNYTADYEAELSQPCNDLLVLAGAKLVVQKFEAAELMKHNAYETTSLLSVLQE